MRQMVDDTSCITTCTFIFSICCNSVLLENKTYLKSCAYFLKKSWFNNIEEEEKEKIGNVTRLDVKVIGQYFFETKGNTTKFFTEVISV